MATLRRDKTSPDTSAANTPAHTGKWAVTRTARRAISMPASLYLWLSGPPSTQLERERATLAYAEGAQGRGALVA